VHKAKGLEWPHVFVSCTAGMFPHAKSDGSEGGAAEEERLFYVACTRAKDSLTLTYSDVTIYNQPGGPSRFLELVEGAQSPAEDAAATS